MVRIAGRPSGIAATARPTAAMKVSATDMPRTRVPNANSERGRAQDHQRQPPAEDAHLLEQRRRAGLDRREHAPDAADLGGCAGGDDDRPRLPLGHQRAGIAHAQPIADPASAATRSVSLSTGTDSPVSADSSTRRLRACSRRTSAGQAVARGEQHDVAGHQVRPHRCRAADRRAAPPHEARAGGGSPSARARPCPPARSR
jgi:hypothetical protein